MKNATFWNIITCSLVKHYRRFGGTYCINLQGRRGGQYVPTKRRCHLISRWFLSSLFFDTENGGVIYLRNVRLHGVISRKIVLSRLVFIKLWSPDYLWSVAVHQTVRSIIWSISIICKVSQIKLSLCLTNEALLHEDALGSGCIDPSIFYLGTSWR
jgi:hypothetical protein